MISTKYRKHRRSKYQFPTHVYKLSQHKGDLKIGEAAALKDIQRESKRTIKVHSTSHTRSQWVFNELRGTPGHKERE